MDHFNAVKTTSTTTGTGNMTVSATPAARSMALSTIPVGSVVPMRIEDLAGTDWELSMCTILSATTFSRGTVLAGSNGTSKVNFSAGTKSVSQTVSAEQLNGFLTAASGISVTNFLATTPGASVGATDLFLASQGSSAASVSASALAAFANAQWPFSRSAGVRITASGTYPLDSSTHLRRKIWVTVAGVTLTGPGSYASAGDDFECEIINLSAGVVTLGSGINVIPSGNTIPVGGRATLGSTAGAIYASLGASAAPDTVAPTAVSALVSNAAPSVVVITMSEAMDGANVPAASSFTVGGHTVSSLTISGNKINLACATPFVNGEAARTVGYTPPGASNARDLAQNLLATFSGLAIVNSVAAAGGSAPFTASNRAGFPVTRGPYLPDSNSFFTDVTPTGTATVVAVKFYVSESNSIRPVDTLSGSTTPRGGIDTGSLWGSGQPSLWQGTPRIAFNLSTETLFYFWIKVTDSNAADWYFRRATAITYKDNIGQTTSTSAETMVAA